MQYYFKKFFLTTLLLCAHVVTGVEEPIVSSVASSSTNNQIAAVIAMEKSYDSTSALKTWEKTLFKSKIFAVMGSYKLFEQLQNSDEVIDIIKRFRLKNPDFPFYKILCEGRLSAAEKREDGIKGQGQQVIIEAAGETLVRDTPFFENVHLKGLFTEQDILIGTSTFDLGKQELPHCSRDFLVHIDQPSLVEECQQFFTKLLKGQYTTPKRYSVKELQQGETGWSWGPWYHRQQILDLIESADFSVFIYQQDLQDEFITTALVKKAKKGTEVKILMSGYPFGPTKGNNNLKNLRSLKNAGAKILLVGEQYANTQDKPLHIHAKVLMCDYGFSNQAMYLGSANFYPNVLDPEKKNLNLGILTKDEKYILPVAQVFEKDWQDHEDFSTATLEFWEQKINPLAPTLH